MWFLIIGRLWPLTRCHVVLTSVFQRDNFLSLLSRIQRIWWTPASFPTLIQGSSLHTALQFHERPDCTFLEEGGEYTHTRVCVRVRLHTHVFGYEGSDQWACSIEVERNVFVLLSVKAPLILIASCLSPLPLLQVVYSIWHNPDQGWGQIQSLPAVPISPVCIWHTGLSLLHFLFHCRQEKDLFFDRLIANGCISSAWLPLPVNSPYLDRTLQVTVMSWLMNKPILHSG